MISWCSAFLVTTFSIESGRWQEEVSHDLLERITSNGIGESATMNSWKRKLRMGMVGGGEGAFIGAVHRMAAALDQQIEMVAGCFSRDPENTRRTGQALYLDPA